jgi:hypothetical protein
LQHGKLPIVPHAVIVGDLNAEGMSDLTDLPDDLTIEGRLLLRGTKIQTLPAHLRVTRDIDLEGCVTLKRLA